MILINVQILKCCNNDQTVFRNISKLLRILKILPMIYIQVVAFQVSQYKESNRRYALLEQRYMRLEQQHNKLFNQNKYIKFLEKGNKSELVKNRKDNVDFTTQSHCWYDIWWRKSQKTYSQSRKTVPQIQKTKKDDQDFLEVMLNSNNEDLTFKQAKK
ncbi:unnamed protein product (macronuclear) [Paramecium tetraurelia]|uniref:Transmembrane protein n=1 Tax=Paramecium tetraurelia TaxID=5888 RepID=A0DC56_PARTE|nr:uncharacterized protein GSPATT00015500001 [Paramecium tetraurelia]CAK80623.1 unnamed protein product [Paramecium tetraurelia]|eukprot:XP_001448020.1 hypothetical protein (macronuclear) [Paramecium tetraurelia strain d4-2]